MVLGIAAGTVIGLASAITLAASGSESLLAGAVALAIYVVALAGGLALFALHQGTTLALVRAERSGATVDVGTALGEALERLPALSAAMFVRVVADAVPPIALTVAAGMLALTSGISEDEDAKAALGLALLAGYAVCLGWTIVVRAYLGLSGPCVVHEGAGPIAALDRSVRLLENQRLKLVGLRLVWLALGSLVYVAGYVPMLTAAVLVAALDSHPLATLILFVPSVLAFYLVALLVLSFDTVLEDSFYVRVTRVRSAEAIAGVFA